jgi:hypothetical protein
MNTQRNWHTAALTVLIMQCSAIAVHAAPAFSYPVAGLAPFQRPANAPVQTASPALSPRQALHGVSSPIPDSLKFLNDQGGWFNPFTHPGMTGPYDLRGWHLAPILRRQKKNESTKLLDRQARGISVVIRSSRRCSPAADNRGGAGSAGAS